MIAVCVPLLLFANGIAGGVMLGNAIGPAALALRLPYASYVDLIKFMWHRYDPFVPLLNIATLALDVAIAIAVGDGTAHRGAAGLFAGAAALVAVLMIISLAKNVPINKLVTALDAGRQPEDWARLDPRAQWKKWNDVRVALVLAAMAVNVAGAALLL